MNTMSAEDNNPHNWETEQFERGDFLKGYKALLLEDINIKAAETLTKWGCTVERVASSLSTEELGTKIEDFDILGIRSKTLVTRDIVATAKKLKAVCCFCIGTDQVDLNACLEYGIPVFHSPTANSLSVVELLIGEIISLSRNLFPFNNSTHSGVWKKSADGSHQIFGKTLGIIGLGNIGTKLAKAATSLGMKVQYYDIVSKNAPADVKPTSFHDLLATSDFISLNVSGSKTVFNLIGEKELSIMKKGSYIINASRGYVIDIPALVFHLKSGHLAGAAIDVYPWEPTSNKSSFNTELANIPNVILTPHIGGSTEEAQKAVAEEVVDSIHNYFCWGTVINSPNFPLLQAPAPKKNSARLINCHINNPGVFKEVNTELASFNITGLYCKSENSTSYAIIDLEAASVGLDELPNYIVEIGLIPDVLWTRQLYP